MTTLEEKRKEFRDEFCYEIGNRYFILEGKSEIDVWNFIEDYVKELEGDLFDKFDSIDGMEIRFIDGQTWITNHSYVNKFTRLLGGRKKGAAMSDPIRSYCESLNHRGAAKHLIEVGLFYIQIITTCELCGYKKIKFYGKKLIKDRS